MKRCSLLLFASPLFVFGLPPAWAGPCPCISNADVNDDGVIDLFDGLIVKDCFIDDPFFPGDPCELCINSCDVNCDGKVNVFDAKTIICLLPISPVTPEVCCDPTTWIPPDPPGPPEAGACCEFDSCVDALTILECNQAPGIWAGPNTTCLNSLCPCGVGCSETVTSFLDATGPIQFGAVDVPTIPENFFFLGSDPFIGPVRFSGGGGGGLLSSDTVVRRSGPIVCPFVGFPRPCDPVSMEIVALNLVAEDPITVSPDGSQWEVALGVSAHPPNPVIPGQLDPRLDHANGGTFDASLFVLPKFTFTKVSGPTTAGRGPGDVKILDYGEEGIPPIAINFVEVPWVINLASFLADTIVPTGDGDLVPGVGELLPGDPLSQVVVPISGISQDGGVQLTFAPSPRPQTQACCLGASGCEDLLFGDCSFFGVIPEGSGTTCSGTICPALAPIPAMSQWGVIVMFLLVLCAGTIQFGRRRSMS